MVRVHAPAPKRLTKKPGRRIIIVFLERKRYATRKKNSSRAVDSDDMYGILMETTQGTINRVIEPSVETFG